jgi:hypothetical protein
MNRPQRPGVQYNAVCMCSNREHSDAAHPTSRGSKTATFINVKKPSYSECQRVLSGHSTCGDANAMKLPDVSKLLAASILRAAWLEIDCW